MSTPGGPRYGRYTTPGRNQTDNQLDPAQVSWIRDWLSSAGLTVSQPNWRMLRVTGTVGQFAEAFDVTFHDYRPPSNWNFPYRFLTPTTDLSVPAGLGSLVLGVGTSDFIRPATSGSVTADVGAATVNRPAELGGVTYPHVGGSSSAAGLKCSRYWGELPATGLPAVNGATPPLAPCGYTPNQLRRAYGLDETKLTGRGQTVAVVAPSMDTLEQDVNTWSAHVGTPRLRPGQLTVVPTPDGSPEPGLGGGGFLGRVENTLDVEAAHGMAPDADIVSIGLSTLEGGSPLDSLAYILDHTDASIASVSIGYGIPPGLRQAYAQVFQEGARQGVGFYFASGDGGTSLAIGSDGSRTWETGWGDGVTCCPRTARPGSSRSSRAAEREAAGKSVNRDPGTNAALSRTLWPRDRTAGSTGSDRMSPWSPTARPGC